MIQRPKGTYDVYGSLAKKQDYVKRMFGAVCESYNFGYIETPMFERQKETIGVSVDQYALGIGKPSDVANLGAFLMSDEASWITAANYTMTGGVTNGKYV